MNIVYTFNAKFLPQVATSICSVCENNRTENITFFLIVDQLNSEVEQRLKSFIRAYQQKVQIIQIGDVCKHFDFEFDASGWDPIATARLLLDRFLPKNINRALYLDGDTIVRGNLSELYNTDMQGAAIGASVEPTVERARKDALVDAENFYYNSGVLLINLQEWRKQKIGQKILKFYVKHGGKLFAPDQDAINGALKGEIYALAPKYNFFNIYNQYPYRFLRKLVAPNQYLSKAELRANVKNPTIVHFLGEERPWRAGNTHQYRKEYKKYLALTPWSDTPDEPGWRLYFVCWKIFNVATKPLPSLRYKIITTLIPHFIERRAQQNRQPHNSDAKVSILIPAYNAEKLIQKAVESALAQTYQNLEIIIVNDGSTDATWQVLQQYQKAHPEKIKILSQKNQGLGATRNVLLENATGDFVVNLDSDDWLKSDYVETMLTALGENDFAIGGFERYNSRYQFCSKRVPKPSAYARYGFCITAGKMFRTDFLRKNNLHYEKIDMGEDAFFNILACSKASKIAITTYAGYCCYENAHSMARIAEYQQAKSFYKLMQNLTKRLAKSKTLHDRDFQFYVLKNLLMDVFLYKDSLSAQQLVKVYRQSISWYKDFLRQNGAKFHIRFQKGESLAVNFTVNGFVVLTKLHLDGLALRFLKRIKIDVLSHE